MKKTLIGIIVFCILATGVMAGISCDKYSSQSSGKSYLPGATWQVNCTNATAVTIKFDKNSYAMTKNDKVFSWTKTAHPPESIYKTISVTAVNGSVSTTTTIWTNIQIEDNTHRRMKSGTIEYVAKSKDITSVGLIGAFIIIIAVAVLLINQKK